MKVYSIDNLNNLLLLYIYKVELLFFFSFKLLYIIGEGFLVLDYKMLQYFIFIFFVIGTTLVNFFFQIRGRRGNGGWY